MIGKAAVAPALLAVCLLTGGCGEGDAPQSGGTTQASSVQATEQPSHSADRAPTSAQLEAMLDRALDPKIPSPDKLDLVEGATEVDSPLFDELVGLRRDNPGVSWHIGTPVLDQPGLAKAQVSLLMGGVNQLAYATFVFDGGQWKLQRSFTCQMITQVGRDSPACH